MDLPNFGQNLNLSPILPTSDARLFILPDILPQAGGSRIKTSSSNTNCTNACAISKWRNEKFCSPARAVVNLHRYGGCTLFSKVNVYQSRISSHNKSRFCFRWPPELVSLPVVDPLFVDQIVCRYHSAAASVAPASLRSWDSRAMESTHTPFCSGYVAPA